MTSPAPSGGSSPLRVGGLALLGSARSPALIGVASLVRRWRRWHSHRRSVPRPPVLTARPSPPRPIPRRHRRAPGAGRHHAGTRSARPLRRPRRLPLTPRSGRSGRPDRRRDAERPDRRVPRTRSGCPSGREQPVRVYNNSTIKGLAARAADDVKAQGWPSSPSPTTPRASSPPAPSTTGRARRRRRSARALGRAFGVRVEPRFDGSERRDARPDPDRHERLQGA